MTKIILEIENCNSCPHLRRKEANTSCSWDKTEDWFCGKSDDRLISENIVQWITDFPKVPDWCKIKIWDNPNENNL